MQTPPPAPTASGSLSKTPFLHLLVYALDRRLTGTFELTASEDVNATLLVHEGCPAKVRTSEGVCFLGPVMQDLGLISQEQLDASLLRMQESPRLQGQILLEMNAMEQPALDAALRRQVERKIEHLFGLPAETTFSYYDAYDVLARYGGPPTPIDPFPVLWRGVRGRASLEHVETTLQRIGNAALRAAASAQLERFSFQEDEQKAIELLLQRPVEVSELTALLGEGPGRVLAYFLLVMKQVDLQAAAAPAPSAEPSSQQQMTPPVAPSSTQAPVSAATTSQQPATSGVPSGQAFARVQLQRQATRSPRVVEEHVAPPTYDPRASIPAMPKYQGPAASDPPAAAALTSEQHALKAQIVSRAELISSEDYFQMLGIERDAPVDVVQKAFLGLVKVWHPDRLSPALSEVKDACSKVFSHLTEAHATLTDASRREQYLTLLKDGGATPDDQAKIQAIIEAATDFQKAEILLKRNGSDPKAYELVAHAVTLDDQPEYVATLAWLDAQRAEVGPMLQEQIAILDRCLERSPRSERTFFYRGMLHKRRGDLTRAIEDFKRVSELNPKNLDAVREVRVHNMRQQAAKNPPSGANRVSKPPPSDKKEGLLGKLFKK